MPPCRSGWCANPGALALAAGIVLTVGVALGAGVAGRPAEHSIEWDGHRWLAFSSDEKNAFLGGFLAGAAASQAYVALAGDTIFDAEALADRLARLRADRALNFPFGANLYHARLHDYYFYVDRLDRPIYQVMAEINHRLQTKHY